MAHAEMHISTITCSASVGARINKYVAVHYVHVSPRPDEPSIVGVECDLLSRGLAPLRKKNVAVRGLAAGGKRSFFGNSISLHVRLPGEGATVYLPLHADSESDEEGSETIEMTGRCINVKLFTNGSLHMTGCRSVEEANLVANLVRVRITSCRGSWRVYWPADFALRFMKEEKGECRQDGWDRGIAALDKDRELFRDIHEWQGTQKGRHVQMSAELAHNSDLLHRLWTIYMANCMNISHAKFVECLSWEVDQWCFRAEDEPALMSEKEEGEERDRVAEEVTIVETKMVSAYIDLHYSVDADKWRLFLDRLDQIEVQYPSGVSVEAWWLNEKREKKVKLALHHKKGRITLSACNVELCREGAQYLLEMLETAPAIDLRIKEAGKPTAMLPDVYVESSTVKWMKKSILSSLNSGHDLHF